MTLEVKQIMDKNRGGHLAVEIILGAVIFITALGLANGFQVGIIVRCSVCAIGMVAAAITYRLMKQSFFYMHSCGVIMSICYLVCMFTIQNNHMYAMCYPIVLMVMLYANRFMVNVGAMVGVLGLLARAIIAVRNGSMTIEDAIICMLFCIVSCLMASVVVNTQIKHGKENINVVQEQSEAQVATSKQIVELAAQLNRKFVEAQDVSDTLNETMDTTHESVAEIAESSRLTAEAVEQQTTQTSDIQQSIQEVGEQAGNIGEISNRTSVSVEEGVQLIKRLKGQADEVAKINIETKTTTEALNESIKDVQAITETILGISSQTNLLALNASIEAARAGEAGKGFAVVADEIRTLSESTRQATEQISAIIERLTQDAQTAADSMMKSADYAQQENELIEETSNKLADILSETNELREGVIQVNNSVDAVISANTMIMDSITNLSAQSQEVSASTCTVIEVSDSSMDALAQMNNVLTEISDISKKMESVAAQ